jgi:hypothetical protein
LTPTFWNFQLPKTPPPTVKKKVGKKKSPQKKVRALPFVLARWRQKKKVGVEQENVTPVILNSA